MTYLSSLQVLEQNASSLVHSCSAAWTSRSGLMHEMGCRTLNALRILQGDGAHVRIAHVHSMPRADMCGKARGLADAVSFYVKTFSAGIPRGCQ